MPEARDRLSRPNNEVAEMPVGILGILVDDDDSDRSIRRTPFRWGATGGGSGATARGGGGGNSFRRGRGGRTGQQSVLPSWYPRTWLGDITHVVQAIERRRVRLGDHHHQPAAHPSDAQLEHDVSLVTPKPKSASCKPSTLGKVPKILAGGEETEFLTPQKKLLNSIDIVEKVVMEELHRLKRTPSAKRAEREKRVTTLMSMR